VSGVVAAMLSSQPGLTADQVKYLLTNGADDLVPGSLLDGNGRIDPKRAVKRSATAWKAPTQVFPSAGAMPATNTWSGGSWNGASWAGGTWAGASWAGASWAGASWAGEVWG
jgi:hypothetical protein